MRFADLALLTEIPAAGEFQLVALLVVTFASFCFWVAQRFTAAITALFQTRLQPLR